MAPAPEYRINPMEERRPANRGWLIVPEIGPDGRMYIPYWACTCGRGVIRAIPQDIGGHHPAQYHWVHPERQDCPLHPADAGDNHPAEPQWMRPEYPADQEYLEDQENLEDQEYPENPENPDDPEYPEDPEYLEDAEYPQDPEYLQDLRYPEDPEDSPEREQWHPYFVNPAAYELPQNVEYYFDHQKQKIIINTADTELDEPER